MALRLRVAYPTDVPEQEAVAAAVADWREACVAAGGDSVGEDPTTTVLRDDPTHAPLGEYVVQVEGGCSGRHRQNEPGGAPG